MADLQPVARTAFYCCALRAADAAAPHPVCGDAVAARFLDDDIVRELEPLVRLRNPAASDVARHRLVDDLVRESLAHDTNRRIILVGAGFDYEPMLPAGSRRATTTAV